MEYSIYLSKIMKSKFNILKDIRRQIPSLLVSNILKNDFVLCSRAFLKMQFPVLYFAFSA